MIFIDTSAYIAVLKKNDTHHKAAVRLFQAHASKDSITSQAVLGEVLTVGSMRIDRNQTIAFVEKIVERSTMVYEEQQLIESAMQLFKAVKDKNIGWVDCYSQAIVHQYGIQTVLTFDQDFATLEKVAKEVLL